MVLQKIAAVLVLVLLTHRSIEASEPIQLSPENSPVPFSYVQNGSRSWPVLNRGLQQGETLKASFEEPVPRGLRVQIEPNGFLTLVDSVGEDVAGKLKLSLTSKEGKQSEQVISYRPAPPKRPVSYVSDMVDDLIHTFHEPGPKKFKRVTKGILDQYFRRLQATGATRLIVWQSPFPYIARKQDYSAADWSRYENESRAILESPEFQDILAKVGGLPPWAWLCHVMQWRLHPEWGDWYLQSAQEHGIKLTMSFRPFEPALSKYYRLPVFDEKGGFLHYFHPLSSLEVSYHAEETAFVHYRQLLREMGKEDEAAVASLELSEVEQAEELVARFEKGERDFELFASELPPVDPSSFVLQRTAEGNRFQLVRYRKILSLASQQWYLLDDYQLKLSAKGGLQFSGLKIPAERVYLRLKAKSKFAQQCLVSSIPDVRIVSRAGNVLGRMNEYWAFPAEEGVRKTGIVGIEQSGSYRTEFQVIDNSIGQVKSLPEQIPFGENELVINLGSPYEFEMIDFELPKTRQMALKQIRGQLEHPNVDEIFLNTRSHIQLAGSYGDGADGIQPVVRYSKEGKQHSVRLSLDRAYVPRSLANSDTIKKLASQKKSLGQLCLWQQGEWNGTCQTPQSGFPYRYERNLAIARGLRRLVEDVVSEFPQTRIRMVIPPSAQVEEKVRAALPHMKHKDVQHYGSDYYRFLRSSLNIIPAIGEATTMVDLSGTNVEPVFLGTRFVPVKEAFDRYLEECLLDLKENRGSHYQGPRSFFYEAQETLRGKNFELHRARREEIICDLLKQSEDINEVLLYESTDWMHKMPLDDPDLYGNGFLDRCIGNEE